MNEFLFFLSKQFELFYIILTLVGMIQINVNTTFSQVFSQVKRMFLHPAYYIGKNAISKKRDFQSKELRSMFLMPECLFEKFQDCIRDKFSLSIFQFIIHR